MAADTSSSAAASTPVVWVAAAAWAALSVEPIFARSVAAVVISSGAAIKLDISVLPPRHPLRIATSVARTCQIHLGLFAAHTRFIRMAAGCCGHRNQIGLVLRI